MNVQPRCMSCKSPNVLIEVMARWNFADQRWEISDHAISEERQEAWCLSCNMKGRSQIEYKEFLEAQA